MKLFLIIYACLTPIAVVEFGLEFWEHSSIDMTAKPGYIMVLIFIWLTSLWQVQKWIKE